MTIGFSEIVRLTALNWTGLTGGAMGMKDIARPVIFGMTISSTQQFYYLFLIFAALFVFMTSRIVKSRVGNAWQSIREDQLAARSLGVEVMPYKMRNFLYGTFWAGLAGALYAPYLMYIDSTIFTLDEGFTVLCMVLIGGLGTIIGPIAGSIVVIFLMEGLRFLSNYPHRIYGLTIILVMWLRPQGILAPPSPICPRPFSSTSAKGGNAHERTAGSEGRVQVLWRSARGGKSRYEGQSGRYIRHHRPQRRR